MNITVSDRSSRGISTTARFVASMAGAALVFSAIAGLSGTTSESVPTRVRTEQSLASTSSAAWYPAESSVDYEAREAAVLAALNGASVQPAQDR